MIRRTAVVVLAVLGSLTFNAIASGPDEKNHSLVVTNGVWATLTQQQRDLVSSRYAIEVTDKGRFAKIINVQGVNESTPGTSGGAQLGGAFGQAQYLDNANWHNYSARNQLGAGIIGALLGSALDAPARTVYRIVYTLKNSDGTVNVIEKVSQSPIYVAPGLCVDTASFTPVRDSMCEDVLPPEILSLFGQAESSIAAKTAGSSSTPLSAPAKPAPSSIPSGNVVLCRLGNTASVPTTAEKCLHAGGTIQ